MSCRGSWHNGRSGRHGPRTSQPASAPRSAGGGGVRLAAEAVAVYRIAAVAIGHDRRQAGADAHALLGVLALEVARVVVQLRERAALGERHEQLDVAQRPLELRGDALAEPVEAFAGER